MRLSENCPTRKRVVQAEAYAEAGYPDYAFRMPRPFTAEDFTTVAETYGIKADGLANQINQVLAENLGNNLSSRVKTVVKNNEALAAAQEKGEREDEEPEALPGQDDLDTMIAEYDFSGVRVSSGESAALSPLDREILKLSKAVIRSILRESGFGNQPGPVTVAKAGEAPSATQVSADTFGALVQGLVNGEAPWDAEEIDGELSPYYAKRQEILEQAQKTVDLLSSSVSSQSMQLKAA